MAWEIRKGNRYFYKSIRTPDGSVKKIYLGKGEAAKKEAERLVAKKLRVSERKAATELTLLENHSHRKVESKIHEQLLEIGFHNPSSRGYRQKSKSHHINNEENSKDDPKKPAL